MLAVHSCTSVNHAASQAIVLQTILRLILCLLLAACCLVHKKLFYKHFLGLMRCLLAKYKYLASSPSWLLFFFSIFDRRIFPASDGQ